MGALERVKEDAFIQVHFFTLTLRIEILSINETRCVSLALMSISLCLICEKNSGWNLRGRWSRIEVFKIIRSEDQKVFYCKLIFNKKWKKNALERNCNKRKDILASLSSMIPTFFLFKLMQFNLQKKKKKLCHIPGAILKHYRDKSLKDLFRRVF